MISAVGFLGILAGIFFIIMIVGVEACWIC